MGSKRQRAQVGRDLEVVSLDPADSAADRAAASFEARGIAAEHVRIDPCAFDYAWRGRSHYLALHDITLEDGEVFTDGSRSRHRKDLRDLFTFVPAGSQVQGWSVPAAGNHSFTALYFDPGGMEHELAARLDGAASRSWVYFADPLLHASVRKLRHALQTGDDTDQLYLESLSVLTAVELCRTLSAMTGTGSSSTSHPPSLTPSEHERVRDYVDANLQTDLRLSDLADIVEMERCRFVRAFKNTAGDTPHQYVLRRRVERAEALLGTHTVSEVAARVGFSSSAHFIRTFRRFRGVTPGRFKAHTH